MNDHSKIRLSPREMELATNADWILTKNGILEKVTALLGEVLRHQQLLIARHGGHLSPEVLSVPPKISRGENYRGLPWRVLDYPRFFDRDDHFAIRSMFWWGRFFSITLHLSGRYKRMYESILLRQKPGLDLGEYYFAAGEDQWEHHFEDGNYIRVSDMSDPAFRESMAARDFIKIAKKIPVERWEDAPGWFSDTCLHMLNMLRA